MTCNNNKANGAGNDNIARATAPATCVGNDSRLRMYLTTGARWRTTVDNGNACQCNHHAYSHCARIVCVCRTRIMATVIVQLLEKPGDCGCSAIPGPCIWRQTVIQARFIKYWARDNRLDNNDKGSADTANTRDNQYNHHDKNNGARDHKVKNYLRQQPATAASNTRRATGRAVRWRQTVTQARGIHVAGHARDNRHDTKG